MTFQYQPNLILPNRPMSQHGSTGFSPASISCLGTWVETYPRNNDSIQANNAIVFNSGLDDYLQTSGPANFWPNNGEAIIAYRFRYDSTSPLGILGQRDAWSLYALSNNSLRFDWGFAASSNSANRLDYDYPCATGLWYTCLAWKSNYDGLHLMIDEDIGKHRHKVKPGRPKNFVPTYEFTLGAPHWAASPSTTSDFHGAIKDLVICNPTVDVNNIIYDFHRLYYNRSNGPGDMDTFVSAVNSLNGNVKAAWSFNENVGGTYRDFSGNEEHLVNQGSANAGITKGPRRKGLAVTSEKNTGGTNSLHWRIPVTSDYQNYTPARLVDSSPNAMWACLSGTTPELGWKMDSPFSDRLYCLEWNASLPSADSIYSNHAVIVTGAEIDNIWDGGGTLSMWIRPRSDGESNIGRIASKGNGWLVSASEDNGSAAKLRFYHAFSSVDGDWTTTSLELPLNEWTHVAVSYDSSSDSNVPTIYVSGSPVSHGGTNATGTYLSDITNHLAFGDSPLGTRGYDGALSEVVMYDDILTQAEVTNLYQGGTPHSDNQQLYLKMDEGTNLDFVNHANTVLTGVHDLEAPDVSTLAQSLNFVPKTGIGLTDVPYVTCSGYTAPYYESGDALRIKARFKYNKLVGNDPTGVIFGKSNNPNVVDLDNFGVFLSSQRISIYWDDAGATSHRWRMTDADFIATQKDIWHDVDVSVTFDDTNPAAVTMVVNGDTKSGTYVVGDGIGAPDPLDRQSMMGIGGDENKSQSNFNGWISDVSLYKNDFLLGTWAGAGTEYQHHIDTRNIIREEEDDSTWITQSGTNQWSFKGHSNQFVISPYPVRALEFQPEDPFSVTFMMQQPTGDNNGPGTTYVHYARADNVVGWGITYQAGGAGDISFHLSSNWTSKAVRRNMSSFASPRVEDGNNHRVTCVWDAPDDLSVTGMHIYVDGTEVSLYVNEIDNLTGQADNYIPYRDLAFPRFNAGQSITSNIGTSQMWDVKVFDYALTGTQLNNPPSDHIWGAALDEGPNTSKISSDSPSRVMIWEDMGASGYHFAQFDESQQPIYTPNLWSTGVPAIEATSDHIMSTLKNVDLRDGVTVFVVARTSATNAMLLEQSTNTSP